PNSSSARKAISSGSSDNCTLARRLIPQAFVQFRSQATFICSPKKRMTASFCSMFAPASDSGGLPQQSPTRKRGLRLEPSLTRRALPDPELGASLPRDELVQVQQRPRHHRPRGGLGGVGALRQVGGGQRLRVLRGAGQRLALPAEQTRQRLTLTVR